MMPDEPNETAADRLSRVLREAKEAVSRIQAHIDRTTAEGEHLKALLEQLDELVGGEHGG